MKLLQVVGLMIAKTKWLVNEKEKSHGYVSVASVGDDWKESHTILFLVFKDGRKGRCRRWSIP